MWNKRQGPLPLYYRYRLESVFTEIRNAVRLLPRLERYWSILWMTVQICVEVILSTLLESSEYLQVLYSRERA
jgi:hypothetical protein